MVFPEPADEPHRPPPLRGWLAIALLALIGLGEAAVPRNSRWPWPMLEDYALFAMLLAGSLLLSRQTSLRLEVIGLYGIVGLLTFWPGQFEHWNGPGYETVVWPRLGVWLVTFVCVWAFCRASGRFRNRP